LMLAALVTTGLLIRAEPPQIRIRRARGSLMIHLGWLLVPIFMALTVASQSRAGIALLIPATAAAMIIGVQKKGAGLLLMVTLGLILAAVAIFAVTPGSVARLMELQSLLLDDRAVFLPDLLYMLVQHWPWGSGLGTFVPVFQSIENLDLLQPLIVNHAHNDLLELLIEGGLPAAILMVALAIAIAWRMVRLARLRRSADPGPALAGFAIVVLLLLHSLVDYPLRTRSLAAVGAVAMVLMFSSAQQQLPTDKAPSRPKRQGFRRPSSGPGSRPSRLPE
ncbi:MAG: O-antigen ligase family protein, partial [Pseudomonadota bacterium]|nr:O-antigen ligase family protein [Pseudomonadota bacterium]